MTKAAREPRRLETGDWVRIRGDDPSIRGVGKLIDADFAREDNALTACQVEVGARTHWLAPADLVRITPDEEARLCDVALARGLVPAERRARLDDALRELRAGRRTVIRTPGLLDLLWATSTLADPTHGSGAVTAFLAEEALAALTGLPARARPVVAPQPPPWTPPAPSSPLPPAAASEPAPAPEWRPAVVVNAPLVRVLAPLDRAALLAVAARCGVNLGPHPAALDAVLIQRQLVTAGVTAAQAVAAFDPRHSPREVLEQALDVLADPEVARVAAACGVTGGASQTPAGLRQALLERASPEPLRQALDLMDENQLHGLCDRLGMEPMWGTFDATDVCARIAAAANVRLVGPPASPVAIHGGHDPRVPPEEVLMRVFDLLSARLPLTPLAARLGLQALASQNQVGALREALRSLPAVETLRSVLARLTDAEMRALGQRLGVPEDRPWDPASARARIANVAGLPPDDGAT